MATKKVAAKKTSEEPAKATATPVKASPTSAKTSVAVKKMSKSGLIRLMAEKSELSTKQAGSILELLAQMATQETKKNGEFTIPGLGKLVKAQRAARIGRNPQTGEAIKIKAKTTVKFRVAKAAKDAVAPPK